MSKLTKSSKAVNSTIVSNLLDIAPSSTPHVWDGEAYDAGLGFAHVHAKRCNVCNSYIMYSYYLNGNLYKENDNGSEMIEYPATENCYTANNIKLTCENAGTCVKCENTYERGKHYIKQDENNNLICRICKQQFGKMINTITEDGRTPKTYTLNTELDLKNGLIVTDSTYAHLFIGGSFIPYYATSVSDGGTKMVLSMNFTIDSEMKKIIKDNVFEFWLTWDGKEQIIQSLYFSLKSDTLEPTISNIQLSENEWTKSKPIIITGTENWTDTVNVKIENDRGSVVFEGGANVTNNNWTVSCTPEIEAGEESRVFTVTVTDACENSTTKNFEVSKVDGRPPTVTSSDKVTDSEWAREKSFTFTAEDLGIGNIEIGFNDVNDYSPAVKNGNNYSKEYKFVGDAYSPIQASVYFKDGLGNITTQLVTLEKIDNTAPTITNASLNNNVVSITSHDRHTTLGEGSGVVKYRYITSTEKLENPQITENNSQEIEKNTELKIPNISQIKYIYIVAEDLVGNISKSYEIEVPQLVLRSEVNQEGANGKGVVILDWTGYDITNKYFVIYRKQEDKEKWKTIIGIDGKLNNNTYTDLLGNDKEKPNTPEITIEKDLQAGQIKINQAATDNGSTYTYYIEAYDQNTNELISKSNTN